MLPEDVQFADSCSRTLEGQTCRLECLDGNDKQDSLDLMCTAAGYTGWRKMDCARDVPIISSRLGNLDIQLAKNRDL